MAAPSGSGLPAGSLEAERPAAFIQPQALLEERGLTRRRQRDGPPLPPHGLVDLPGGGRRGRERGEVLVP
ncbi:MAG: hypothetical protein ABIL09_29425, partial [Gemmatimonadota bacterium]